MKPQNLEEKVVWYYIIGTLLLYFLGAQYVAAPLMAYFLVYRLVRKWWTQTDETPIEERVRIPVGVWVWMGCISFVAIALVMSHLDFGYGNAQIAKSLVNGFLRTWALFAVFPLIGCLNIRPQIIYRAICILCLQCLILVPITYVLHFAGIDPVYGVGLLKKIGGNSYNYYQVRLYIGAADGMRLYLFAPWAPALGLVANVFFWLSTQEADKRWRFLAMLSCAAMILGSGSRLGLICLIVLPIAHFVLINIARPTFQITAGVASFFLGAFGFQLLNALLDLKEQITAQRSESSRVREVLGRMALYRWQDAPVWGHGLVATDGPKVSENMPIGSHHTWFGLLYTHGLVGLVAFAAPLVWSFIELLIKAQNNKVAQVGLGVILVLIAYSNGENLETLAYLYWPGLVLIGIAMNEKLVFSPAPQPERSKLEALT